MAVSTPQQTPTTHYLAAVNTGRRDGETAAPGSETKVYVNFHIRMVGKTRLLDVS
jgi:hypothetical protein